MTEEENLEMWAVVSLMGHQISAGIIRPSQLGGLIRVEVPIEEGFRTEYYGPGAIYSIKVVSEEIARAYAAPERKVLAYDEPIVPRAEYEQALEIHRRRVREVEARNEMLRRRLTTVEQMEDLEEREPEVEMNLLTGKL